jgi:hypothetical protein
VPKIIFDLQLADLAVQMIDLSLIAASLRRITTLEDACRTPPSSAADICLTLRAGIAGMLMIVVVLSRSVTYSTSTSDREGQASNPP